MIEKEGIAVDIKNGDMHWTNEVVKRKVFW